MVVYKADYRIRLSLIMLPLVLPASGVFAADSLPRSSPESQGVSSAQIRAFVEAADQNVQSMHSLMVLRHGNVVAEGWWAPESAEKPHGDPARHGREGQSLQGHRCVDGPVGDAHFECLSSVGSIRSH